MQDERPDWGEVMRLARSQLGLISRSQIEEAGFSTGVLVKRLQGQEWVRIFRGWFKIGTGPLSSDQKELATMLIAGRSAVLSHLTAARRLGLDAPTSMLVDVTLSNGTHGARYADARIHRARDLRPYHWLQEGPFRVTTPERTVLDLAEVLDGRWLSALVFSAIRRDPLFTERMLRLLCEQGNGRTGVGNLQALLDAQTEGQTLPQSVPESFLLELVQATGLRPVLQYPLGPRHHVDFAWPEQRLAVEVDGWSAHASHQAFGEDRRRDREVVRASWRTLRFTRDEVVRESARVVAEIREVLEAQRSGGQSAPETTSPEPATGSPDF